MKRTLRVAALLMIAAMVFTMMPLNVSAAAKRPDKTKVTSVTNGKVSKKSAAAVTLKWKKVKNATGYEIYQKRANETKYKKVKTVGRKATSVKLKNLRSGKYLFKVRAIRKVNGKTVAGAYSEAKSKFIKSSLTVQNYVKQYSTQVKPVLTKALNSVMEQGATCTYGKLSYSGNTVLLDINAEKLAEKAGDLPLSEALTAISTVQGYIDKLPAEIKDNEELQKLALQYANTLKDEAQKMATKVKNETGVSNVKIKVRIQYSGYTLAEKQF